MSEIHGDRLLASVLITVLRVTLEAAPSLSDCCGWPPPKSTASKYHVSKLITLSQNPLCAAYWYTTAALSASGKHTRQPSCPSLAAMALGHTPRCCYPTTNTGFVGASSWVRPRPLPSHRSQWTKNCKDKLALNAAAKASRLTRTEGNDTQELTCFPPLTCRRRQCAGPAREGGNEQGRKRLRSDRLTPATV